MAADADSCTRTEPRGSAPSSAWRPPAFMTASRACSGTHTVSRAAITAMKTLNRVPLGH